MDESANTKEVKIRRGLPLMRRTPHATTKNIPITQQRATLTESELWLAFYILWLISNKAHPFDRLRLGVGCRLPAPFRSGLSTCERNERSQV